MTKKIAIANDHGGLELKELLKAELIENGYDVLDLGSNTLESVAYPDFGYAIAKAARDRGADTVVVAAPPPPESPKWMYGIGAVMIIGLLGAGGFFAWSQIKLRAERLELEGHNLTQEERDELEASRVVESLYGESQQTSLTAVAAMPAAAGASGWEGPPSAEQSYESIAGMGSLQSAQPVTSDIGQDMLDALVDEPQSQPESKPEVDGDLAFLDDLKDSTSSVQQPSQPAATGAGLAIDIPGLAKAPEARPKGSLKIELPSQPSAPQPGASEPGAPQPGASEPGTPTPDDLDI